MLESCLVIFPFTLAKASLGGAKNVSRQEKPGFPELTQQSSPAQLILTVGQASSVVVTCDK